MPGRQGECAKGHRWLVPILRMSRSWRMGIRSARDTDGVRPVIIDRRYVVLGCQQYDCRAMDDHKGTRGRDRLPTRVQLGYDRFDFNLAANGNQLLFHASAITVRMPPHVPAQPTVFVTAVAAKPFQSISDQWA
jgi:hypothetical protein